jgi:hypothetical protein
MCQSRTTGLSVDCCFTVFTLNFLPYKPTGPVSSIIYRPEFENYINDH